MQEQIVNTQFFIFPEKFLRHAKLLLICLLALAVSACLPSGEQDVNTTLFKSKEELKVRATELQPGMSRKATFETIGVAPEKFERMSAQDVQMCIYGNSQVQGTPEQLEQFKNRMLAYEGYALPYREIKSNKSLGFGKMKVNKTGYDLRLVLVFEKNRLLRAAVEGTQEVNQQEDQYLWDTLIRKGIGLAF